MVNFAPQMQAFLEVFFGNSNRATLASINVPDSNHAKKIKPFVDRLSSDNPLPSVIPFIDSDNKVTWFGLAFDENQFSMLGDSLYAFLGPSFSTFHRGEQKVYKHSMIPHVEQITKGHYFMFEADGKEVHSQLTKMFGVWERRPKGRKKLNQNIDQLLRDFYTALEVKNQVDAEVSLQSIRDLGQFNAQNFKFLQIQYLSAFQLWDDLFALPGITDVIIARRPLAVTEALLSGIYAQHIAPYEDKNDIDGAMEHFRKEPWPSYSALFQYRRVSKNEDVLKCYAVHAVALSSKQYDISELKSSLRDPFYQELLTHITPQLQKSTSHADPYKQAQVEMENGRTEQAFKLLLTLPVGVQRTMGLLNCALDLLDLSSIKVALDAYEELESEEKQKVRATQRMQNILQKLQTFGQDTISRVPGNWIDWIHQLEEMEVGVSSEIARQGAVQWEMTQLIEQDPGLTELYTSLCNMDVSQQTKMIYAISHLISFFRKDEYWPRLEWKRIYLWLSTYLLKSSCGAHADLTLFNSVFKALNTVGLEVEEYCDLMEHLLPWMEKNASTSQTETIMETCECIVTAPYREFQLHLPLLQLVESRMKAASPKKWQSVRESLAPRNWHEWFYGMKEQKAPTDALFAYLPDHDAME
ncbi:hypothetical protein Q5741_02800 [Paenibacillus sp. JX-17]|uniref:Uncharacterized protein n=1 Tax=Paenibacillus lacisoli TaxID=3064525 RepID=A0ABT9C7Y0_9BACL|nr:hypothetical protein [Paenibacillus sp. JX-17]MDO7905340.1 hypothetical protein [Paenibacillus sp. JX-17]